MLTLASPSALVGVTILSGETLCSLWRLGLASSTSPKKTQAGRSVRPWGISDFIPRMWYPLPYWGFLQFDSIQGFRWHGQTIWTVDRGGLNGMPRYILLTVAAQEVDNIYKFSQFCQLSRFLLTLLTQNLLLPILSQVYQWRSFYHS